MFVVRLPRALLALLIALLNTATAAPLQAQVPQRPVSPAVVAGPAASPEQFGAVGDCVADDTKALLALRDHLRATQDANPGTALLLTMTFRQGACYRYTNNRWTWGLKHLRMLGNGASFQNTHDARKGPWTTFGAYVFISNRGPFSNLTSLDSKDRSGSQGATGEFPNENVKQIAAPEVLLPSDDLAQIIYIDHYGNAFTGLRGEGVNSERRLRIRRMELAHARVFHEAPTGQGFWYVNSVGLVEIAMPGTSAAKMLGLRVGQAVEWAGGI